MSLNTSKRPSPAMIVAALALTFALAGTAIAADPVGKLTKSKVKSIAKKQADKRLKANVAGSHVNLADSATNATNANHANTATNATNATNATSATSTTTNKRPVAERLCTCRCHRNDTGCRRGPVEGDYRRRLPRHRPGRPVLRQPAGLQTLSASQDEPITGLTVFVDVFVIEDDAALFCLTPPARRPREVP